MQTCHAGYAQTVLGAPFVQAPHGIAARPPRRSPPRGTLQSPKSCRSLAEPNTHETGLRAAPPLSAAARNSAWVVTHRATIWLLSAAASAGRASPSSYCSGARGDRDRTPHCVRTPLVCLRVCRCEWMVVTGSLGVLAFLSRRHHSHLASPPPPPGNPAPPPPPPPPPAPLAALISFEPGEARAVLHVDDMAVAADDTNPTGVASFTLSPDAAHSGRVGGAARTQPPARTWRPPHARTHRARVPRSQACSTCRARSARTPPPPSSSHPASACQVGTRYPCACLRGFARRQCTISRRYPHP